MLKSSPVLAPRKSKIQAAKSSVFVANTKSTPPRERRRVRLETRAEMLERLTNPQISLHEAGVILRVCGATVRAHSDAGFLPHARTPGGQRRFYLRDVLAFLRQREAEKKKK